MNLIHWSNKKVTKLYSTLNQPEGHVFKPHGFWISDESDETSWKTWCEQEEFRPEIYVIPNPVRIIESDSILYIRSAEELDTFTDKYGKRESYGETIDWNRVSKDYKGILITPYIWEKRMDLFWYYGWDCASGCIWDVSCIELVNQNETELTTK